MVPKLLSMVQVVWLGGLGQCQELAMECQGQAMEYLELDMEVMEQEPSHPNMVYKVVQGRSLELA